MEDVNYADSRTDAQREEDAKNPGVLTTSGDISELEAWGEKVLAVDADGKFIHSAADMATLFNSFSPKHKEAWDVIKIRSRYGKPAVACHKPGKKFVLGTGSRKQNYIVGHDGTWRKVVNV